MALTISVVMLKGGVGKTTTAVALAEAASLGGGPVVLVDSDPMGAAVRWSVLADQAKRPLAATVIGLPAADLPRRIGTIARDAAVIVVDSPPPGALHIARGAVQVADIVVMPTPPGMADLDRMRPTVAEADASQVPAYAVLTMTRPTADRDAARKALSAWGVRAFSTELRLAVSVSRNYGQAPNGILADFGQALLTEVLDAIEGGAR